MTYGTYMEREANCKLQTLKQVSDRIGLALVLHSPAQPDDGGSEARSTGLTRDDLQFP
jgi:hypothetical protein